MYGAQTGIAAAVHSALTFIGGWSSPAKLFANNEQGAWYDPQDYGTSGFNGVGTLYQDSAGTTPVTAVEQPVGLMLDKRKGIPAITELLTNNDFATDTIWSKGTGWSIAAGVATKVAGSASSLTQPVTVTTGTTYRVVYTITRTAGTITPQLTGGSTVSGTSRSASGTYVDELTAVSGNVTFGFSADASFAGTVDNVYLKRVAGNDAYQTTSAARPTLRARYNQITYSEQFDNAAWAKTTGGTGTLPVVTDAYNAAAAPDGTFTASRLQASISGTTSGDISGLQRGSGGTVSSLTGTVWVKSNTGVTQTAWFRAGGAERAQSITTTWTQITDTGTSDYFSIGLRGNISGAGTLDILLWHPDQRATNLATGLIPLYQRIAAATDYDTVGFPVYIQGNGSSQFMLTSAIDFSGTDKMTVWSAVRKLSDAAQSCVAAIGLNGGTAGVNNEQGLLLAPGAAAATTYYWRATGSLTPTAATATGYTSPHSAVLAAQAEIATDLQSLRVNGAAAVLGSGDIGTGNFGSGQIIYLLARGGTTLWFGGYFYGAIIRGAASNEAQIQIGERYLQQRSLAY